MTSPGNTHQTIKKKEQCPCGSGRQYRNCCKKKDFLLYRKDGKVFKKIPLVKELSDELKNQKVLFKEIYGREVGEHDFIFFGIYNDKRNFDKFTVKFLRDAGFPEEFIYAYTQTGLIPTEFNTGLISDTELEEFTMYVEEYRESIQEAPASNKVNILMYIEFSNHFLNEVFDKLFSYLMYSYNYFIRTHLEERQDFFNYSVQSYLDFGGLCAIKTLKNLESIGQLIEYELEENILATTRFVFESYLYLVMLNQDKSFFQKHILNNSKSNRLTIKSMSERSMFDQDKKLYELFFKTSSKYVHLDVLTAQSYFKVSHPFEEVNRSLVASIIGTAFSILTLEQISILEGNNPQFKQDIRYMTQNAKQDLIKCFEVIKSDASPQDEMYSTMISRLRENKTKE
ncbi:SEC-C domain-containing protein [Paenibacillus oenotherae]|uniref:SEC-C domain-containing protein n=1 Tax=Paenibacillus oenotherae TaxID=1435645 RepID=A0ABS7DBQ3_9BACL|nr:SEC-C domain-containing protein [Paenibacillus oenotherae]MBW7477326.1 SEC-C domain-containing protein [Paenibacillus oenotherae]